MNKIKLIALFSVFLLCACKEEALKSNEVIADQTKKASAKPQAPIHKIPVLKQSKWDPDQWPKCGSLKSCNREFLYIETDNYIFKITATDQVTGIDLKTGSTVRHLNCETEALSCSLVSLDNAYSLKTRKRFNDVFAIRLYNNSASQSTYEVIKNLISQHNYKTIKENKAQYVKEWRVDNRLTFYELSEAFFVDAKGYPILIKCDDSPKPSQRCSTSYFIKPNLYVNFNLSDEDFLRDVKIVNGYIHSMIYKEKGNF